MTSEGDRTSSFRTDIQGLRAVAVLAVLVFHADVGWLPGGYVGVDVFFVISGFLITAHLLSSLQREGRIRFAGFYARRARRILPASIVVLVLTLVASIVWMPPLLVEQALDAAIWTVLYVPNVLFAIQQTDYLAESAPSVFQHYWSLGVEEQFYLFWPALLAVGFLVVRSSVRRLGWIVLAVVVASFALCLVGAQWSQPWTFFSLPTRAWELGVGGLVAFAMRRWPALGGSRTAGAGAWLGLVAILVSILVFTDATPFPGFATLVPVLGAALVMAGGGSATRWSPRAVLSIRPMQFVGTISYSLYLVHWPLQVIPQAAVGLNDPLPEWARLVLAAAALPLAYLCYRFVEQPFRTVPALARARPRTTLLVAAGVSACIVVAAAVYPAQVRAPDSEQPVAESTAPPPLTEDDAGPVTGTLRVPSNLRPPLSEVESDLPAVYSNGCHLDWGQVEVGECRFGSDEDAPLVALFGDSHAASWFPAFDELATAGEIRLESYSKSDCPSVDLIFEGYASDNPDCVEWQDEIVERLAEDPPAVIVLANFGSSYLDDSEDPRGDWITAIWGMIERLPETSQVMIMADIPDMESTPAICLSANLDDTTPCWVSRSDAVDPDVRDAEESIEDSDWVDLIDAFCDDETCFPVIGDMLVYQDSDHLTATYSKALAPAIRERLDELID